MTTESCKNGPITSSIVDKYFMNFFAHKHKAASFKHCIKQGMTATASNRSQKC